MRIARVRVGSFATPVIALEVRGELHDAVALEERWELPRGATDFHTRVFALRCAGLRELADRLDYGARPTQTRLAAEQILPLAPCDSERARYLQVGPYELGGPPCFRHRDARSLCGTDAAIAIPGAQGCEPEVEGSLVALLGEELWRADGAQAARAIVGYSLALDWSCWQPDTPWEARPARGDAPSQVGPVLVTPDELDRLLELGATMSVGAERWSCGKVGDWRWSAVEAVSFVSHFVQLRAGDVVSTGRLRQGAVRASGRSLPWGARVCLEVEQLGVLRGWALEGPPLPSWHAQP